MQKEFINVAAHELRTHIRPILGLADILRSNETDSGTQQSSNGSSARNKKR
jgi:signal transduction histidine kinase